MPDAETRLAEWQGCISMDLVRVDWMSSQTVFIRTDNVDEVLIMLLVQNTGSKTIEHLIQLPLLQ